MSQIKLTLMNSSPWAMLGLDFTSLAEELLHGNGKMVVTLIKSNGGLDNLTTVSKEMKIVPEYSNLYMD